MWADMIKARLLPRTGGAVVDKVLGPSLNKYWAPAPDPGHSRPLRRVDRASGQWPFRSSEQLLHYLQGTL